MTKAKRKFISDYAAALAYADEEGDKRGEARGVLRTAKRMKAKGFNTAVIAEITRLSIKEIDNLA